MSMESEPVEFWIEPTGLSPRSLRYLHFKQHFRAVSKPTVLAIEIDDDQVEPDFVVDRSDSPNVAVTH